MSGCRKILQQELVEPHQKTISWYGTLSFLGKFVCSMTKIKIVKLSNNIKKYVHLVVFFFFLLRPEGTPFEDGKAFILNNPSKKKKTMNSSHEGHSFLVFFLINFF